MFLARIAVAASRAPGSKAALALLGAPVPPGPLKRGREPEAGGAEPMRKSESGPKLPRREGGAAASASASAASAAAAASEEVVVVEEEDGEDAIYVSD